MSEQRSRSYRTLTASLIYLLAIAGALAIATMRSRAKAGPETEETYEEPARRTDSETSKPFFSLSTHRTYASTDNPKLWVDYQGVDHLDFRVYQVKDPRKFFMQLKDPHQMGEDEEEEVTQSLPRRKSFLERVRSLKRWAYSGVKTFVRAQLKRDSRQTFNQKFRKEKEEETVRTPLNVADYARVPLLNPDAMVTTWREPLQPLEEEYDKRMIPLGKRAAGVYLVEAVAANDLRAYTVVVVTDLTMIDKTTRDGDLIIYAVDRKTGQPRSGAEIEVVREKQTITTGKTDEQGIFKTKISTPKSKATESDAEEGEENAEEAGDAEIAEEEENPAAKSLLIFARHSGNFAISDHGALYMDDYEDESSEIKSYIYTDRPVYRPNHKVYFKGIVRAVDANGAYKSVDGNRVNVTIEDPNNATIFNKEISLTPRGTFAGDLDISEEAPLGSYNIVVDVGGVRSNGSFEVAEYKKPEYKVTVSAPSKFVQTGQKTNFSIDAKYFFGSPVANAEVKYYIYRSRYYAWGGGDDDDADVTGEDSDDEDEYSDYYYGGDDMVQESEGNLDARGHLNVDFEVPQTDEKDTSDYSYRLEAQVTDSARRTMDGAGSFVATRGTIVADANPERYVYQKGDVAKVRVNTTDYEGHPVSTAVQLQFVERTWTKKEKKEDDDEYSYPEYDMHERVIGSGSVQTDAQGQASFDYTTTEDGNISIKTIIDEGGKKVASIGGYLWVTDYQAAWSESSYYSEDHNSIKLVPDKKSYRPGETARVLAILPTDQAHLLVSTELTNVMSIQHVNSPGRTIVLDVPIVANYAPNVFLNVAYVKNGNMHSSDQRIVVPARDKMLNLEIISNKNEYKPRETASYTVLARNADGAPVSGAEVSLGIVDESIYSVASDYSGNIKSEFYGMRYSSVDTQLSISYSFIGYAGEKPMELARNKPTYQLADFKNESTLVQPTIRKNFKDTAFWQPDVVTGADGKATVKVELPDNLTTWRATARGVTADTKVGATKYKVLARKDVIMRLETPRFITQGDTVTLSGIVHNYLNADKSTQISIEVTGAQLQGAPQQTVNVKKQGEHRVDWQVSAQNVGEIKLLAKALTDTESDAVELPIMVVPRGLHQVKNESWTFAEEAADKTFSIALPNDADPRARSLRIEIAPSVAGTLFGALDYLTTYPYGCTEQTMSSFLPNVVVSQALKEVKTSTIRNPEDLQKKVRRGLDRLYAYQHEDGGWGWWKDDQSDPFMTAYVVSGLTWAKAGGFDVADDRIGNGREKLKQMLDAGKTEAGTTIDLETRAFMVYALEESGDLGSQHLESIYGERGNLQPYGRALLALTLKGRKDDKRAREVAAEIERTATSDSFYTSWESRRKAMLDFAEQNDTEATALSLKALASIKPDSSLLPRVARWLVSNRRNSHYWSSTKDTAFAIFGLIDYLKVSKELSPNYDIEVYLNGENVLTEHVSSPSKSFSIIRKATDVAGTNDVRIVKRGSGLTYFATSLDYYSGEEDVAARGSADLNVTREYLRLKVVEDGYKLKWQTEPLRGEIRSGDILVVKLKLNGAKARHLMIEDPIPAGAEQVESVGNLNLDYATGHDWSDWYSSREFRDNRTVFFLDYFDGDATFQYAMRVQVPGQFRVAPARAELMYRPATQSNTASGRMSFLERK
ncbi:MAG TPA: MG2 domain-containing protein [Pyrinomonadaceae bacterium]|nr:MG2 domain-containing protein [Pyrinomonadaceae bacterium]